MNAFIWKMLWLRIVVIAGAATVCVVLYGCSGCTVPEPTGGYPSGGGKIKLKAEPKEVIGNAGPLRRVRIAVPLPERWKTFDAQERDQSSYTPNGVRRAFINGVWRTELPIPTPAVYDPAINNYYPELPRPRQKH